MKRNQIIIKTSIIGILTNIFLAIFKAFIGFLSHSLAIILDAVNNLSDALSSIVTIIGTKLANKPADKKHPLGYGRLEYLSSMIVAAIVLYAGITSFIESIKKIFNPETPNYTNISLIIIAIAIIVKLILGNYFKRQGGIVNSDALIASGKDASFDAILSLSVLISAIIFKFTGLSLEAYVGVVIAIFIIKAGYEMIVETIDNILGRRIDKEISTKVKSIVSSHPKVLGAYDLVMNNYGPDKDFATIHIELPDNMKVKEVDKITRDIQNDVQKQTGVIITGVSIYSYNTDNDEAAMIRNKVQEIVLKHDYVLQMHAFYVDVKEKHMRFDVVLSFDIDQKEAVDIISNELKEVYPEYTIDITPDVDISD